METIRTYSHLISLPTFEERFEYLKLGGTVGRETFGCDRFLNQSFYKSQAWMRLKNEIIVRDNGRDLAHPEIPIRGKIIIHHLNPITALDIEDASPLIMDPEFLVCVSMDTHNAIHFGDSKILDKNKIVERLPGDTCPWKR